MAKTTTKKKTTAEEPPKISAHDQKIQDCKDALDRLNSDTTVCAADTYEDLKDVKEHLDMLLSSLRETMREEAPSDDG